MPIYLYWGEDDFALEKAVTDLRDRFLDPQWATFNYDKIHPDRPDAAISGLNQAMTPPFGAGRRLVWLVDTTICQHCSEDLLTELDRTLPEIPESSVLLLTSRNKPDGRLKSTKLLQKFAGIQEFSLIPPWKTEQLVSKVQQVAQETKIKITPAAAELLAQSIGNDTRLLYSELNKLSLYIQAGDRGKTGTEIGTEAVSALVMCSASSSLQLAAAIRQGNVPTALAVVSELINRNEPALRIVATLTGQFRTWLWIKLMADAGERDDKIAQAAEIGNPKRVYFLKQEVKSLSVEQLISTLPILLELELNLKRGAEAMSTLQTKVIELCHVYNH